MKKIFQYILPAAALSIILCACISSEETGASAEPIPAPKRAFTFPRDTQRVQPVVPQRSVDTLKPIPAKVHRASPKLKSRQDTVKSALVKKARPVSKPSAIQIERPNDAMYTVQVGAFLQAPNALRNLKRAKERYPGQPVYNRFHKKSGFYRISVGRFADAKDAFTFRLEMMKSYPREYSKCWVNYIAR